MTSALAAALRELDRSSTSLEQELSQNADFAALRRIEAFAAPLSMESERQRLDLIARLAAVPAFRAWRAIWSVRQHVGVSESPPKEARDERGRSPDATVPEPVVPLVEPSVVTSVETALFARPASEPQPLTAIRGIDATLASKLRLLGVERYDQIAGWRADDVRAVRAALGLGREISRRNWIEQAALLAQRTAGPVVPNATSPMASAMPSAKPVLEPPARPRDAAPPPVPMPPSPVRLASALSVIDMRRIVLKTARAAAAGAAARQAGGSSFAPVRQAGALPSHDQTVMRARRPPIVRKTVSAPMSSVPPPVGTVEPTPRSPSPVDPFARISGIDADTAGALVMAGVARFSAMSAWTASDVRAIAARLNISTRRISREGWIEQAALLALGRETAYSERVISGEVAALCPAPPPPTPASVSPAPVSLATAAALAVVEAEAIPATPDGSRTQDTGVILAAQMPIVPRPQFHRPSAARTLSRRIEDEIEAEAEGDADHARDIDLGEDLIDIPAEEATVTIVTAAPARPVAIARDSSVHQPASAPATTSNARGGAVVAGATERPRGTWAPAGPPPPGGEEAVVEIIRRDAPGSSGGERAPGVGAPSVGDVNRQALTHRTPYRDEQQPVWIADPGGDAGGVLRRFLKALKRDG